MNDPNVNARGVLFETFVSLPDGDGYFGYHVFKNYVEYVDLDSWTGGSEPKYWSHEQFYKEKKDQPGGMEQAVINFLKGNNLISL